MFKLEKMEVEKIAIENSFLVNSTEKVLRLIDVVNYINSQKFGSYLALKGGTAINFFVLNLPRLSVDIDYDFSFDCTKEEMWEIRDGIRTGIIEYMDREGYVLSENAKYTYALDSFVYKYQTTSGSSDNLKIEINYMDRIHIYPTVERETTILGKHVKTRMLAEPELIGSKLNALIRRTVVRDVVDTYNLLKNGLNDLRLIKKIVLFYVVMSSQIPIDFDELLKSCIDDINSIDYNKMRENVLYLLHRFIKIDIEEMKSYVESNIRDIFKLNENELMFISEYNNGNFNQDLLFEDYTIERLDRHPMLNWMMKQNNN